MKLRIKRHHFFKSIDGTIYQYYGIQYKNGWFWRYLYKYHESRDYNERISFDSIKHTEDYITNNFKTPQDAEAFIRKSKENAAKGRENWRRQNREIKRANKALKAEHKRIKREEKVKYITI